MVTEVCDVFSFDSEWDFVEPQSSSFSHKSSIVWEENQGEMGYKGSPVKATSESQWQATEHLEQSGKEGDSGNEKLPGKKRRYECGD